MKTNKVFTMFALTLSLLLIATFSLAAKQTVTLMPGPDGKGAGGEAVISDAGAGQKKIDITVRGLKPDEVYTVWFVNMKPKMDMAGLGTPDYVIKLDRRGGGRYTATVTTRELEKWQLIEIASHPTGDPRDMKKMGIALKGELVAMGM
jgi:hypothetical protein